MGHLADPPPASWRHRYGRNAAETRTEGEGRMTVVDQLEIVVYSQARCPYYWGAGRLLRRNRYAFETLGVVERHLKPESIRKVELVRDASLTWEREGDAA